MTERRARLSLLVAGGCVSFFAFSGQADAACSRSDVEFYLEKGFSHEQVLSLCSDPAEAKVVVPAGELPSSKGASVIPAQVKPGSVSVAPAIATIAEPRRSGPEKFLVESIKGYDIAVTPESVGYTRKDCFQYGPEDQFGFQEKACPEIRYTIRLLGLDVLKTKREFLFFGGGQVEVVGGIDRTILNGLEEATEGDRKLILKKVHGDGNTLVIPVQDGVPLNRVADSLRELAR